LVLSDRAGNAGGKDKGSVNRYEKETLDVDGQEAETDLWAGQIVAKSNPVEKPGNRDQPADAGQH